MTATTTATTTATAMRAAIKDEVDFSAFSALDMRIGRVVSCQPLVEARKPAYVLTIDFGAPVGLLQSSAQITALYECENVVGSQVVAVVNFPAKRIASVESQCLVLGVPNEAGEVVLLRPESLVPEGVRVF